MIYVVEPHSDDAYLSLHGHMVRWIHNKKSNSLTHHPNAPDVQIITVYSGTRKRAIDAYTYAHAIGVKWMGLGLKESGGGLQACPRPLAEDTFDFLFQPTTDATKLIRIIVPLSFGHPEHRLVRDLIRVRAFEHRKESRRPIVRLQYYLDTPYQITQNLTNALNDELSGMRVVSFLKPHAAKWEYTKYFKDQSKFMYLNRDRFYETFEMIVEE